MFENDDFRPVHKLGPSTGIYEIYDNARVVICNANGEVRLTPAIYKAMGNPTGIKIAESKTQFRFTPVNGGADQTDVFKVTGLGGRGESTKKKISPTIWAKTKLAAGGVYPGVLFDGAFVFNLKPQEILSLPSKNRKK